MKIIEIEISNVRGIRHLLLKPGGHSFAVTGPNGSGKSAVVDAIDFLLTGRIQRLLGKGTGGLSLKQHGPHIDTKPSEASVRAVVVVDGSKDPIEISRTISAPDELSVVPDQAKSVLRPVLTLAARGQHVLSRREILKYITAEAKTRAEEIQSLLNLSEIESTRSILVKTKNGLGQRAKTAASLLSDAKTQLATAAGLTSYDEPTLLEVVNQNRALLKGKPLVSLSDIQVGISPPSVSRPNQVNSTLVQGDIGQLGHMVSNQQKMESRGQVSTEFAKLISDITNDPAVSSSVDRLRLIEIGVQNLDETGACPLCDKPWPLGELKDYLDNKLRSAKEAAKTVTRIREISNILGQDIVSATATADRLIASCRTLDKTALADAIVLWKQQIESARSCLDDPLSGKSQQRLLEVHWETLSFPELTLKDLTALAEELTKSTPKPDPGLTAWDMLTRINERVRSLDEAKRRYAVDSAASTRSVALLEAFEKSRDTVLGELFGTIKDRFVALYRALHKDDEEAFDAVLRLQGPGLDFQVDFHGKGNHPPHALHSEGHQDSMGLCLYLALAEHLNSNLINLVVLDDVVMSVDSGHRRELCKILKEQFPTKQFIITTHERAWARQLQTDGAVGRDNLYTFYNWTVDLGPRVNEDGDMWKAIDQKLEQDDVPGAAHQLRYGLEAFFQHACSALGASVRYNWHERWDLGDFLDASVGQLKKYLGKAKAAAKSWGNTEVRGGIQELESVFVQTVQNSNSEQWAVNPSVHWNNWANLSKQDFRPVTEAMQELCAQFTCQKCHGIIEAVGVGKEVTMVKCPCGEFSLNLSHRKK